MKNLKWKMGIIMDLIKILEKIIIIFKMMKIQMMILKMEIKWKKKERKMIKIT